jgi:hypothetical protein
VNESPEWIGLANDIRAVDGNHDLGAGALAEALTARGWTRAAASPDVVLRLLRIEDAAEEALDRMGTAFNLLSPDATDEDKERVAQTLWFGQETLREALEAPHVE